MAAPSITPLGWVVLGGLGLLVWRGLRRKPSSPQVKAQGPVDLIGDSLAVGLAGPLNAELAKLGGVQGWGVGGSTAASWTSIVLDNSGTVIVSLGTNDSVSPDALSKFPARIETIVDKIRAAGALPILLASPSQLPNISKINAALAATSALVISPPAGLELSPDKVHPTGKGYAAWAKAIARVIA